MLGNLLDCQCKGSEFCHGEEGGRREVGVREPAAAASAAVSTLCRPGRRDKSQAQSLTPTAGLRVGHACAAGEQKS